MQATQILIVEDDLPSRELLCRMLQKSGFHAIAAHDTLEAETQISKSLPDLILLDWNLPGMNGPEYARQLKKKPRTRSVPIIMLTAQSNDDHKVEGLECGADDYMTKPYSIKELIARINLRLRQRDISDNSEILEIEGIRLEPATYRASANGNTLELDHLEFNLLSFFMRHPEQAISRQQLLVHVWGSDQETDERTVDVYIRRLRKALQPSNNHGLLQTVRCIGYRFSTNT